MTQYETTGLLYWYGEPQDLTAAMNVSWLGDDSTVDDANGDANLDVGETYDYNGTSWNYTGYTVEINGNTYGIFTNGTYSVVPYNQAFDNLNAHQDPSLWGPVSMSGDDTVVANCFMAGTHILTPDGERPVETLSPGDMVQTMDGCAVPVRWVAQQTLRASAVNMTQAGGRAPVRICKGALGDGLPHADLDVSEDHGMVLEGMIVNAAALVDGDTIRFLSAAEMPPTLRYFHVELDAHEIILANGAATEPFVDYVGRHAFDNYDAYLERNRVDRIIPEMSLPRISARRLLPDSLKRRLGRATEPEGRLTA